MTPVWSREEQHSVSPGSLQLSLGSSPTHCSGALRCFVLKYNNLLAVVFCIQKGHLSPWIRTDPCMLMINVSRLQRDLVFQDKTGRLSLPGFKVGVTAQGKWYLGHFTL